MQELEEEILSMLVNGNTDTREYDNAMREYVKAVMVGLEITGCINPTK